MNSIKIAILGGFLASTASAAMAADLPRAFLPSAPLITKSKASAEGWYLRGDIGYVHNKRPEADFAAGALTGGFVREGFDNAPGFGIGLGYRFNANFRADLTADYFSARFKGVAPTPTFGTVSIMDRGELQSTTVLLNGYLDFGTAAGFTPYVGAGIGFAYNDFSGYERTTYNTATGVETWQPLIGGDDYSFAWALMAGVNYRISSNAAVDLGYRYVSRGDLRTRNFAAGAGADVESIGAHEVRLGVRYGLN